MTIQDTPVSRFRVGDRVRVRVRHTGRPYPGEGQCYTVQETRVSHWMWVRVDRTHGQEWYAPELLEPVR